VGHIGEWVLVLELNSRRQGHWTNTLSSSAACGMRSNASLRHLTPQRFDYDVTRRIRRRRRRRACLDDGLAVGGDVHTRSRQALLLSSLTPRPAIALHQNEALVSLFLVRRPIKRHLTTAFWQLHGARWSRMEGSGGRSPGRLYIRRKSSVAVSLECGTLAAVSDAEKKLGCWRLVSVFTIDRSRSTGIYIYIYIYIYTDCL